LLEIFKKIYENGVHGCLFDIDQQGNLSNDHSERIEELERSLIKYKNMERELQCIISTKTLELQESNENFNILQEFTENCIQVIEEVRNLCTGSEKFKDLLPAIHEILELHEKLL
jgi:cellulose biosynthesis protein BcsQ